MTDDPLVGRLRNILADKRVTEQKMFGGTCFMLSGNMLVGASKRGLLVRVGKDAHAKAVARPHATAMEMRGRTMQGFIFVAPEGTKTDKALVTWIGLARAFVETLPPKGDAKKPGGRTRAPKSAMTGGRAAS